MVGKKVSTVLLTASLTAVFEMNVFAANAKKSGFSYGTVALVVVGLIVAYIIYTSIVNRAVSNKGEEVNEALEEISKLDATWDKETLRSHVQDTFYRVQGAISNRELPRLQALLHPKLYSRWENQILEMDGSVSRSVTIDGVSIVDVKNYKDDELDSFTAAIDYSGEEYTVHRTGKLKFIDIHPSEDEEPLTLREYWTYERENNEWVLLDVHREESWRKFIKSDIVDEDNA